MLPSRGLRPAHFAPSTVRLSPLSRASVSRKFSSLPRTARLPTPSQRTGTLQSARWRTGTSECPNVILGASSVRYASWYAPWSWGKQDTPAGDASASAGDQVPIAEFANSPVSSYTEPVVTSQTPELAPAGIDKAAVTNSTSDATSSTANTHAAFSDPKTIDDLLGGAEPVKDVIPKAEIDPTVLIDHAGQLKELGLDYGWGMTTMFEKMIEQIYLQSGFGWAGTIALAAVGVRCATFFFQALSSDRMASLAALKPLTVPIQEKLDDAIARGDKQQEQAYRMQQMQIMKPHVGGMFSMGGFMVMQGWIGFCAFRFLRAMSELPVPGLSQDGFMWFTDLTVRDPYFLIPAATTAVFYTIFKTGGETGISNDIGAQASQRQKLLTGMAVFLGLVTAWQAAVIQIYFLCSGILGAGTGWLLRQNTFRSLIRIRPLPSPASNALYTKVVKGDLRLADIKGKDGKVRYQAPNKTPSKPTRRNATTLSGIKVKDTAAIPAHLKPEAPKIEPGRNDRDVDYEEGPKGTMMEKLDYYRRNYRVSLVGKRMKHSMEDRLRNMGYGSGKKMTEQQARRKKRAEDYEIERRRRFENRS